MDGSGACARMHAFVAGGRARPLRRRALSHWQLGRCERERLRRLLKERYAADENDCRFGGSRNTLLLIDHVLAPKLATLLVMHACAGDEEKAVEFLERPIVGEAERRRLVAEARGGSRLRRALERL